MTASFVRCRTASALLAGVLAFAPLPATGCGPVLSFVEMVPKPGAEQRFFDGYRRDLEWHASIGDPWTWLGWVVANGPRRGTFVDAAVCLDWSSSAAWPVDREQNDRLNAIHYLPHVERSWQAHRLRLDDVSALPADWHAAPNVLVYHVQAAPGRDVELQQALPRFARELREAASGRAFGWLRGVLGEPAGTYLLVLPTRDLVDAAAAAESVRLPLDRLAAAGERVASIRQETWRYRADLSYFPPRR